MCGIAGIIGNIKEGNIDEAKKMLYSISHRGPDKLRVLETNNALLAFARLKIIDFKDRSMQPMISEDKKHVLIFNGEIYNYKKLKIKIANKYNFKTSSDTEVLLAMLIIYGSDALNYVNGMFSFCYYDVENQIFTLARDRFGQKSLYYSIYKHSLYFSSEIKGLLAAGIDNSPDYKSISYYLHFNLLDCNENTWFNDIKQLKAGEYIKIKDAKIINKVQWYDITKIKKIFIPKKLEEKKALINKTFINVCEEHLNSDTKIGVNLSGGLDSSTMLASMEKNKKYLSNQCFAVDFYESLSEKKWITATANYFKKKVDIYSYKKDNFLNDFDKIIYSHEGPLGGLMNCAFESLYKEVKNMGIRVLLDGTGLDEAFGGYRVHHLLYLKNLYDNKHKEFFKNKLYYLKKWQTDDSSLKKEFLNLEANKNLVQDGSSFNQQNYTSKFIQKFALEKTEKNINKPMSIRDHLINYIIRDKIPKNTRMKDRQSMSYSIELRMPFLDHRIIELGLSLDEKLYFKKGYTKSIIRETMRNRLPENVRLGQKRSIQSPQGLWLQDKTISKMILQTLSSKNFRNRGIFDQKKVVKDYLKFLKFGSKNTYHIWQWLNVEKFFNVFEDNVVQSNSKQGVIELCKLS